MGLAEDNDVIKAFPVDRADQSLRIHFAMAIEAQSGDPGCPLQPIGS
jgi:hypothetical protein